MASSKNYNGQRYHGWKSWEQRVVEGMDERELKGENRENVDEAWQNYHFVDGDVREWSF